MSRISDLFSKKKNNILNIYCTAGYPELDSTIPVMMALEKHGADMIELGMPYSDPLADGPVIQASSGVAIKNGMTIARLFEQLEDMRARVSIPVLLMGYMNPILQFGFEKFCKQASESGIDGLIIPDLPVYEYETKYAAILRQYGLEFIFLVTPETSPERTRKLDTLSSGFIYAVSASSTTGSEKSLPAVESYLQKLRSLKLKNPILVGFGIRDRAGFESIGRQANGAIIGTAFIKALEHNKPVENSVKQFLHAILGR